MFYKLKSLKILVETNSFVETAKRLSISQPAVSQHIKFLQVKFSDELFQKINNQIVLTPKGRTIYELIAGHIDSFDLNLAIAESKSGRPVINMIGPSNFTSNILIPYVAKSEMGRSYCFNVIFGNSQISNEKLLNGDVDLCVVSKPLSDIHIKSKIIFKEGLNLFANAEYINLLKKKAGPVDIDIVDMSNEFRLFNEWYDNNQSNLNSIKFNPRLVATVASIEGILNFVVNRKCAAVLPTHFVNSSKYCKLLKPFLRESENYINKLYLCKLSKKRDIETNLVYKSLPIL
jgi:DNA-binding transcriptional LysR family regulator